MAEAVQSVTEKAKGHLSTAGGIGIGFHLWYQAADQFDANGFAAVLIVKLLEGAFSMWVGWKAYSE